MEFPISFFKVIYLQLTVTSQNIFYIQKAREMMVHSIDVSRKTTLNVLATRFEVTLPSESTTRMLDHMPSAINSSFNARFVRLT